MITEEQVRKAAFWEEDLICLGCGVTTSDTEDEEIDCALCGGKLVRPSIAILVLDRVERVEEQA